MALSDRYTAPDTRSRFEKWLDTLTPEHRAIIGGWMADPSISNAQIMTLIRDDDPEDGFVGVRVTKDTVSAWRRANVAR